MSEFIEIGSYIIRVDDIVLLDFRVNSHYNYGLKEGDCVIDVLLVNGVELTINTNCTTKKRFEEVKRTLNERLATLTESKCEIEPRRFKVTTTTSIIRRKRR